MILKPPTPPAQRKMLSNPCGRVLTSHDCIREMEEKAEKKETGEAERVRKEEERKGDGTNIKEKWER